MGMSYLHDKKLIHGDLSARNLLLHFTFEYWDSPKETMWEIFSEGKEPFAPANVNEEVNPHELLKMLNKGERPPKPPRCPAEMFAWMEQCWKLHPKERPSVHQLIDKLIHNKLQSTGSNNNTVSNEITFEELAFYVEGQNLDDTVYEWLIPSVGSDASTKKQSYEWLKTRYGWLPTTDSTTSKYKWL